MHFGASQNTVGVGYDLYIAPSAAAEKGLLHISDASFAGGEVLNLAGQHLHVLVNGTEVADPENFGSGETIYALLQQHGLGNSNFVFG